MDSDDGSYKYNISSNFMVYGGCKNYLSADKACGPDNVILYPGIENRSGASFKCQSDYNDPSGALWNQYYFENSYFQAEEKDAPAAFFSFFYIQGCKGLSDASGYRSWNNTYPLFSWNDQNCPTRENAKVLRNRYRYRDALSISTACCDQGSILGSPPSLKKESLPQCQSWDQKKSPFFLE